jgi:hypothetical protein
MNSRTPSILLMIAALLQTANFLIKPSGLTLAVIVMNWVCAYLFWPEHDEDEG